MNKYKEEEVAYQLGRLSKLVELDLSGIRLETHLIKTIGRLTQQLTALRVRILPSYLRQL